MGRHKNDPSSRKVREVHAAVGVLYDAALKLVSPKPKEQSGSMRGVYAGIREAYGYSCQRKTRETPKVGGLLGVFQSSSAPTVPFEFTGRGGYRVARLDEVLGPVPDELKFPLAPSGDNGLQGLPEIAAEFWEAPAPHYIHTGIYYLNAARYAALRFVSWATESLNRIETMFQPKGTWRITKGRGKGNAKLIVTTSLAGIERTTTLQADGDFGKPGHLLYCLLTKGHGVCDHNSKHDLCLAVPELAPFIRAAGAHADDASGAGTKRTRYRLDAAIRKRFRRAKKSESL